MKRTLSAAMSLLLAAVSASAQVPASTLLKIGTAAAVAGSVKAVSAGSVAGHVISSGKPLYTNDHVTTDAAGRLQVLLIDETIFTLGPNSDMVLDDFVYDPKTSAGKITATIAKGAFRFVTGKIAQRDPSKLKIKVAVGTIGVRGSIGVGETGPGGTTIINGGARNADNHDDAAGIYAESGGKVVNLPQPGVGTHISPDGKIAGASFMGGELNRIMGTLQTPAGKGGGKGGEPAGSGRRTATDASGRGTAVGGLLASDDQDTAGLISSLNSTLLTTTQGLNGGTVASWDSVRSLSSGVGTYVGNGTWTCTAACSNSGVFDFSIPVDFAARSITNGGTIHITGSGAVSTDSAGLIATSYANATGQAIQSLAQGTNINSGAQGNFSGTTLTFVNIGGQTAGGMNVKLNYAGTLSSNVLTGTGSGSR
jgi:hypothetical protein